ncbi:MAG: hypothetical protein EOO11_01205 [Chitinophagaceae bacterium]|nr:MAG: hypothetical protein EOO11_01205 [Chitinophagaceae bacterium]
MPVNKSLLLLLLLVAAAPARAQSLADSIRFTYTLVTDTAAGRVTLFGNLENAARRPFTFLSRSCGGLQQGIVYQQPTLRLLPGRVCNASRPVVYTVAPGKSHVFESSFRILRVTDTAWAFDYRIKLVSAPWKTADRRAGRLPAHTEVLLHGEEQK